MYISILLLEYLVNFRKCIDIIRRSALCTSKRIFRFDNHHFSVAASIVEMALRERE